MKEVEQYASNFSNVIHHETSSKLNQNIENSFKSAIAKYHQIHHKHHKKRGKKSFIPKKVNAKTKPLPPNNKQNSGNNTPTKPTKKKHARRRSSMLRWLTSSRSTANLHKNDDEVTYPQRGSKDDSYVMNKNTLHKDSTKIKSAQDIDDYSYTITINKDELYGM